MGVKQCLPFTKAHLNFIYFEFTEIPGWKGLKLHLESAFKIKHTSTCYNNESVIVTAVSIKTPRNVYNQHLCHLTKST